MSLTQKHYTSFLATINEKKDELETLIDRLQLDTRHRTYMTTGTQVIIIGKQTVSHQKTIQVIIYHFTTCYRSNHTDPSYCAD